MTIESGKSPRTKGNGSRGGRWSQSKSPRERRALATFVSGRSGRALGTHFGRVLYSAMRRAWVTPWRSEGDAVPTYDYRCDQCERTFEVRQRISADPLKTCERCGGPIRRLLAATPFILKGGGWYVTDYPSEGRKKGMETEKKSSGDAAPSPAPATTGTDGSASSGASSKSGSASSEASASKPTPAPTS